MMTTLFFKTAVTMVLLFVLLRVIISFFQLKEYDLPEWVYIVIGFGALLTMIMFAISGILYLWY
jgi:hypothetical protein